MPLDPCFDCECIPPNIPNDIFKQMVLQAICNVVAGISGSAAPSVSAPEVVVAFGSLNAAFTNTNFVPPDTNPDTLNFINSSDVDVEVSTDNSNTWLTVFSNSSEDFDFTPGKLQTTSIYVRRVGGAATLGAFKIQGTVKSA